MASLMKRMFAVGAVAILGGSAAFYLGGGQLPGWAATRLPATGDAAKGAAPAASKSGRKGAGGGADMPVPVLAAQVKRSDVPIVLEGVGTARALKSVTVKPQVDGRILRIPFREGQEVKPGDLIAEIDPTTYQAQLDQLEARKALTQTQLDNARRDYDRYLKIPGVVAQKTVDTQRAQVEQLQAQIKADEAAIASARAVLGYTRITSPIEGRVGMRMVDEGNLVRSGDAGIVMITQLKPISVLFTLPQQQLPQVLQSMAANAVKVEALDGDSTRVIDTGTLTVVDNQIDQQTGTVRMKADFPNAQLQLWPGQFTNVRVKVDTLKDVVTVPVAAVQRGPTGTFVYVVADDRATVQQVSLGLITETEAVVTKGLDAFARVVTSGFARLSDGARVVVQSEPEIAPVPAAGTQRQRGRSEGRSGAGPSAEGRRKRDGQPAKETSATAGNPQGAVR